MSHCYWAVVSCKDPKTIIVKYRNRILSIHIKDGKEVDDKFVNTVIGEGIIDYEGIVAIAKKLLADSRARTIFSRCCREYSIKF
jgi:sugar phosphate isomerase/epimerase